MPYLLNVFVFLRKFFVRFSDGSNVFNVFGYVKPGIVNHKARIIPVFLHAHHEMAQRDSHIDLLQVARFITDIAFIPLFLEVEIAA